MSLLTTKDLFKEAYRMARTPDVFLADTKLLGDIPIHIFLCALQCASFRLGTGTGFKGALK